MPGRSGVGQLVYGICLLCRFSHKEDRQTSEIGAKKAPCRSELRTTERINSDCKNKGFCGRIFMPKIWHSYCKS